MVASKCCDFYLYVKKLLDEAISRRAKEFKIIINGCQQVLRISYDLKTEHFMMLVKREKYV